MHRIVVLLLLSSLLLTAQPTSAYILCGDTPQEIGAVPWAQCAANGGIDYAEAQAQNGIQQACIILFGEPC